MPKDFQKEIENHQRAIEELYAEWAAFKAQTPDQQLATVLHDAMCRWNHTDGCSWFYEVHKDVDDWTGSTHERWVKKAKDVRAMLPPETDNDTIVRIARAVGGL